MQGIKQERGHDEDVTKAPASWCLGLLWTFCRNQVKLWHPLAQQQPSCSNLLNSFRLLVRL